ncbi:hypothetical protein [Streptomyces boncukensis]|uniref:Uncharacterized protein n=1 Tax=Streptomyces boncukensis TaxID=2711219 RepID=A0A6G4WZQ1_9ACTN|nr:hypothetical protein [Streptomyces boncukensis]NGO70766.1 hypothetical protein [Streptomyces boncukensis]
MPQQREERAAGGLGSAHTEVPALPDLTGIDLHTLYLMDDAALLAAVRHTLRSPEDLTEMWKCAPGGEPPLPPDPPPRCRRG